MSLKQDILAIVDQLDDYVGKSTSDPVLANKKVALLCLETFWPEFMRSGMQNFVDKIADDINLQSDTRSEAIFRAFLEQLMESETTKAELAVMAKLDGAVDQLGDISCFHVTDLLKKNLIQISCAAIKEDANVRRILFGATATAFYKAEGPTSISSLSQCYNTVIIDAGDVTSAKSRICDIIAAETPASSNDEPFIVLESEFEENAKGNIENLDNPDSLFDIVFRFPNIDQSITPRGEAILKKICENTMDGYMSADLRRAVAKMLLVSPEAIVSQSWKKAFSGFNLLTSILFHMLPGKSYKIDACDENDPVHGVNIVHVLSREEIGNIVQDTIDEHRRLTEESYDRFEKPWCMMSILVAVSDIVERIYGSDTIAKFIMPLVIMDNVNHRSVFDADVCDCITTTILKFYPKRNVACTRKRLIAEFMELLAKDEEFAPEPECGDRSRSCEECAGCDAHNAPSFPMAEKVDPEWTLSLDDVPRWTKCYVKLVPLKYTEDDPTMLRAPGKKLTPDDFLLHVSKDGTFESYQDYRSIGLKVQNYASNLMAAYTAKGQILDDVLQYILPAYYPTMKEKATGNGSIFTSADMLFTMPTCFDRMPVSSFTRNMLNRVPFFNNSLWMSGAAYKDFMVSDRRIDLTKVSLCKAAFEIYNNADAKVQRESHVAIDDMITNPRVITVFAEELYKYCFMSQLPPLPHETPGLPERDAQCFIEQIRTLLKIYGLRRANSARDRQFVIANVIVQLMPIDFMQCIV